MLSIVFEWFSFFFPSHRPGLAWYGTVPGLVWYRYEWSVQSGVWCGVCGVFVCGTRLVLVMI